MKAKIYTTLLLMVLNFGLQAQCKTEGLRDGSFSGWSQSIGLRFWGEDLDSIKTPNTIFDTLSLFKRTRDTSLYDPFTENKLRLVPPGMDYSIRIGNYSDGAQGERLATSFKVTSENALFTLHFAAVSERPDHPADRQPLFGAKLRDQNDSVIFCTDILYIPRKTNFPVKKCTINTASSSNPTYIEWLDWQVITLDLRQFIGQSLDLDIANGDCGLGSHFSLGYFAIECQPAAFGYQQNYCLKDGVVTLVAPKGFEAYEWSDGTLNDTAQFVGAKIGDTVSCKLTSNYGCESFIEQVIDGSDINAKFSMTFDTSLIAAKFTNLTSTLNSGVDSVRWSFGDGNFSSDFNPIHEYDSFGVFTVSLVAISDSGCSDSVSKQFVFYPPAYPAFALEETCGLTAQFIDLSKPPVVGEITGYNWTFGDGNSSTEPSPKHRYSKPGRYFITLITEANGVVYDTVSGTIAVYPFPVPAFDDDPACVNNPTLFEDRSEIEQGYIASRLWRFGKVAIGDSIQELVTFPDPGFESVSLEVTSDAGCLAEVVREVEIYPQTLKALFEFSPRVIDVLSPRVEFTDLSTNPASWIWLVDDSVFSEAQNPTYSFSRDTGRYEVELMIKNEIGCLAITSQNLIIEPTYALFIPNTYTPDADGINDWFEVRGEGVKALEMVFYDRWGRYVRTLRKLNFPIMIDPDNNEPIATYYYEASIIDKNGFAHRKQGRVTVLR